MIVVFHQLLGGVPGPGLYIYESGSISWGLLGVWIWSLRQHALCAFIISFFESSVFSVSVFKSFPAIKSKITIIKYGAGRSPTHTE